MKTAGSSIWNLNSRFIALLGMLVMAVVLRWLPLPPNFAPIGALALFAGFTFRQPLAAFAFPLVALLASDAILGFHDLMWATYLGFAVVVGLGLFLKDTKGAGVKVLASITGTMIFFVLTNVAVWAQSGMYPKTQLGLTECFVAALPFLDNAILGDLVFTAVLFGSWAVLESLVPSLQSMKTVSE